MHFMLFLMFVLEMQHIPSLQAVCEQTKLKTRCPRIHKGNERANTRSVAMFFSPRLVIFGAATGSIASVLSLLLNAPTLHQPLIIAMVLV